MEFPDKTPPQVNTGINKVIWFSQDSHVFVMPAFLPITYPPTPPPTIPPPPSSTYSLYPLPPSPSPRNGNCPNCGSSNVILEEHRDGGVPEFQTTGWLWIIFGFCCGAFILIPLGILLLAIISPRKTGSYCRCMDCGQQWSC